MQFRHYNTLLHDGKENGIGYYICSRTETEDMLFRLITTETQKTGKIALYAKGLDYCDFVESFFQTPHFCMVFNYRHGTPLSEILNNPEISDEERRKITKSILEVIITKNTPHEISLGILKSESIIIYSDYTAGLDYRTPSPDADDITVCKALAELIEKLWGKTITENEEQWLVFLKNGEFKNLCEAYFAMPEFEISEVKRKKKPLMFLTAISGIIDIISPIIAIIISLAVPLAVAFLMLIAQEGEITEEKSGNISEIGTVEL